MEILMIVLKTAGVFAVLALLLGVVLAFSSRKFAVKVDERVEAVTGFLPGANCGGCGYTGCAGLAAAIVKGEAPFTGCPAGGKEAALKIAEYMGGAAGDMKIMRARVLCAGTCDSTKRKYDYSGMKDCIAESLLARGDKNCAYGCLGLGTCVASCRFDAIKIIDGVAKIDPEKCTGCSMCVRNCPKHIIKLLPVENPIYVACSTKDKGAAVTKYCDAGCISCRLCTKVCPTGAITVDGTLASINTDLCISCGACMEKCPRKIIRIQ